MDVLKVRRLSATELTLETDGAHFPKSLPLSMISASISRQIWFSGAFGAALRRVCYFSPCFSSSSSSSTESAFLWHFPPFPLPHPWPPLSRPLPASGKPRQSSAILVSDGLQNLRSYSCSKAELLPLHRPELFVLPGGGGGSRGSVS